MTRAGARAFVPPQGDDVAGLVWERMGIERDRAALARRLARAAPCGARTRTGSPCCAPPVLGPDGFPRNGRCRRHGGAPRRTRDNNR